MWEAGQFDTVLFQQQVPHSISPLDVRIKVAAVGANAEDFYVLAGRVDTLNATCQLECAGIVSAVITLAVDDRVVSCHGADAHPNIPNFAARGLPQA